MTETATKLPETSYLGPDAYSLGDTASTVLEANLEILRSRHPAIADKLLADPQARDVCVLNAKDGGTAYALQEDTGLRPLTDTHTPLARIQAQLTQNSDGLTDCSRPVMVVGLYPGDELLYIFDLSENDDTPHADQQIYVCVDSTACLYGFLQTYDATDVLKSDRVHLFFQEDTARLAAWFRNHPEQSPAFTVLSGSPNGAVDKTLGPFVPLIKEQQDETDRLLAESNAYYDSISDEELAGIIAGKRPDRTPRLMLLTCAWSTVTQYSARDTATAFRKAAWDVRHLNVTSMPSRYYIAKQISEFKPDVFLFINHLRTEATDAYPRNMMFVSWIQDTIAHIHRRDTAEAWNKTVLRGSDALRATGDHLPPSSATRVSSFNAGSTRKRDLIIGYTGMLRNYGYAEDRLREISMIVNPEVFKPYDLTAEQIERYGCDVMFASNAGQPSEDFLRELILPAFAGLKPVSDLSAPSPLFPETLLLSINDYLWKQYRAERTLTSYQALENAIRNVKGFSRSYDALSDDDKTFVIQTLFWKLNDVIYRHVVLEWLDDYAERHPDFKLHLYGKHWHLHPRFSKYAKGELDHGEELSVAYQAAKCCLHLNSLERNHQRLLEILASGATSLIRSRHKGSLCSAAPDQLNDKLFSVARRIRTEQPQISPSLLAEEAWLAIRSRLGGNPLAAITLPRSSYFDSYCDFQACLSRMCSDNPTDANPEGADGKCYSKLDRSVMDNLIVSELISCIHSGLSSSGEKGCPIPSGDLPSEAHAVVALAIRLSSRSTCTDDILHAFAQIHSPGPEILISTTRHLISDGADEEARRLMHRIETSDLTPAQASRLAIAHADCGNVRTAGEMIDKTYNADTQLMDLHASVAFRVFLPQKDYSEALRWLEKDFAAGRLSSKNLVHMARSAAAAGHIEDAVERVELIRKERPLLSNAYSQVGWAAHVSTHYAYDRALPFFERDSQTNHLNGQWLLNYAEALAACNRMARSNSVVRDAYEADHSLRNGYSRCAWARHFLLTLDPDRAMAGFMKDISLGRLNGRYHIYHAILLACAGNLDHARNIVAEAYRSDPLCMDGYSSIAWYHSVFHDLSIEASLELIEKDRSLGRQSAKAALQLAAVYARHGLRGKAHGILTSPSALRLRSSGEYTLIGAVDYLRSGDLTYMVSMIHADGRSSGRSPGYFNYIHATFFAMAGRHEHAEQLLNGAASTTALSATLAESWMRRIGYDSATLRPLFTRKMKLVFDAYANTMCHDGEQDLLS